MDANRATLWEAEIREAGWQARYYGRNFAPARMRRAQALARMAGAVRAALEAGADPGPIMLAVADALKPDTGTRFI